MDEKERSRLKLFQDSFTEALMLLEHPDMSGKNYGVVTMKLRDAYRQLPFVLSLLEKKEKEIEELKVDRKKYFDACRLREESLFSEVERREKAEARIKELEAKLQTIKADPSIGKLEVEGDWPESPDY